MLKPSILQPHAIGMMRHIISVCSDIKRLYGDNMVLIDRDCFLKTAGQREPPGHDTNKDQIASSVVAFKNFMSNPRERTGDIYRTQKQLVGHESTSCRTTRKRKNLRNE